MLLRGSLSSSELAAILALVSRVDRTPTGSSERADFRTVDLDCNWAARTLLVLRVNLVATLLVFADTELLLPFRVPVGFTFRALFMSKQNSFKYLQYLYHS